MAHPSGNRKLLTTRVLDEHGKIGPFFFKESLFLFAGTILLFFIMIYVDSLLHLKRIGFLLIVIPSSFLIVVSVIRFFFIKKIESPWYIHKWAANQFLYPRHINIKTNQPFKPCFPSKKA
jgi:hypothetical protein